MILAHQLKTARLARHMTRPELAQAAGVSAPAVYAWETTGKMPKRANIERLAGALGVSYEYLTGDADGSIGSLGDVGAQTPSLIIANVRRDLAAALSITPDKISVSFEIRV